MAVVQLFVTFRAKSGRERELADALTAAVDVTRTHEGVLNYQFYRHADGSFAELGTYQDAASLGGHMQGMGDRMGPLLDTIEEMSMSVFGPVPDEMKAGLAQMGPTYYEPLAGFTVGA